MRVTSLTARASRVPIVLLVMHAVAHTPVESVGLWPHAEKLWNSLFNSLAMPDLPVTSKMELRV